MEKVTKVIKKIKRHYQKKECPYCHKHFGNLENHIARAHPTEKAPVALTKEDILGGQTGAEAKEPPPSNPANPPMYYHSTDSCNAELRLRENPCWKCGEYLDWDAIIAAEYEPKTIIDGVKTE